MRLDNENDICLETSIEIFFKPNQSESRNHLEISVIEWRKP